jgi:hypothetical protein
MNYRLDAGASRGGFEAPSCPALSVGCLAAFWSAAAGSPEDTGAKDIWANDTWAEARTLLASRLAVVSAHIMCLVMTIFVVRCPKQITASAARQFQRNPGYHDLAREPNG